jgi:KDO2-lipid IV(A) lauroyltransferase
MGTLVPSGFDAPIRLANTLQRGGHVAMLVDQYELRGVEVTFFGRTCKVSPLIGQLARHTNCLVRGIRMVRLPDGNHFWGEITDPLDLPRDAQGLIDVQGAMQAITSVVEGWVREHPEQWLWLHRRWR